MVRVIRIFPAPRSIKKIFPRSLKKSFQRVYFHLFLRKEPKIFCVGRNKTGTTSFAAAMKDLGYVVGDQRRAEKLFYHYRDKNFQPIIDYCKSAQVFQDFPFSVAETYQYLDKAFPGSKFILTVRDSPEQWFSSLVNFHSRIYGRGRVPTKEDLQNATYIWKGRPWETNRLSYATPEDDPYNKKILIDHYNHYNANVIHYFRFRPNDLLIFNVAEYGAYRKLTEFLGLKTVDKEFPWRNKS